MSAETIPSDVATDLDCIRWYVECLDAVAFKRRAVAGLAEAEGSYNAAMKRLTDRSTRPAEPAAPVAEAGDGEVSHYIAKCREMSKGENGHTYTWWSRLADLLSTLEAERARADAAEQRAADALARAEKAEGEIAEAERREKWELEQAKINRRHHDAKVHSYVIAELGIIRIKLAEARASREAQPATDGGDNG